MFIYSVDSDQYFVSRDGAILAAQAVAAQSGRAVAVLRHTVVNDLTGKQLAVALLNDRDWSADELLVHTIAATRLTAVARLARLYRWYFR